VSSWINFTALGQIVLFGLLAGAGLPALVAVGVRSLYPRPDSAGAVSAQPGGVALAVTCFAVVLAAIGYAIYLIVAGSH
jgi:hypothetical protein